MELGFAIIAQVSAPQTGDSGRAAAWIVGLLGLAALVGLIVFIWRRRAKAGEPKCGKCGYAVAGLPSFTCPECGSDLRSVGIVAQKPAVTRPALRLYLMLAAWSLVYAALYVFVGMRSYPANAWQGANRPIEYGLIDAYVWPYEGKSTHTVILTPRSDAYRRLTVTEDRRARFHGWRNAPLIVWTGDSPMRGLTQFDLSVRLDVLDGKSYTMNVDTKTMRFSYEDPQVAGQMINGRNATDGQAIWGWMLACGVDMPSPVVKEEADTLADLLNITANSGSIGGAWSTSRLERIAGQQRDATPSTNYYAFSQTRGSAQDYYGPAWNIYWLSIPFWLGIYTYGVSWIVNRHRKLMGRAAVTLPQAAAGAVMTGSGLVAPGAPVTRSRTLTVLFSDLEGFTARTAESSRQNLIALLKLSHELVEVAVKKHSGTIVKRIGDAHLVTFESATDGVLAGLEIQTAAERHNLTATDAGEQLHLRIALSTGEVTLTEGDVYGTPVNLAARVQTLAKAGQVLFTESTYHAMNAAEILHSDIGSHELKGIATPVRVFRAG